MSSEQTVREGHQRLRRALGATGLSLQSLSDLTGYSPQYISDLRRGRYPLSEKFVARLEAVLGLASDWILTGDGEMWRPGGRERLQAVLRDAHEGQARAARGAEPLAKRAVRTAERAVPFFSEIPDEPSFAVAEDAPTYELAQHLWGPNRYVLRVSGDDMWPVLYPGDLVLVEQLGVVPPEGLDGRICAVAVAGDRKLRRLRVERKRDGRLSAVLQPANPASEPQDVSGRLDFRVLGTALYIVERHL